MPPVVTLIGKPDCGKTTLLEKLIPALAGKGIRTGTIKHHHGEIEMDTPGKDTWRHKKAGAEVVALSSSSGIGLTRNTAEDTPVATIVSLYYQDVDLVVAEGYKDSSLPKIEVFRSEAHSEPLPERDNVIAMVSDVHPGRDLPCFGHDEIDALVEFLMDTILNR